jgi:hypothetical protein
MQCLIYNQEILGGRDYPFVLFLLKDDNARSQKYTFGEFLLFRIFSKDI